MHQSSDCTISEVSSFTWSTILKSAEPSVVFDRAFGEVIGIGMFLPLFWVIDLKIINGLIPAAREPMILDRLLIAGSTIEVIDIGDTLCFLVLRPRGSMALQGSRIMSAQGIL